MTDAERRSDSASRRRGRMPIGAGIAAIAGLLALSLAQWPRLTPASPDGATTVASSSGVTPAQGRPPVASVSASAGINVSPSAPDGSATTTVAPIRIVASKRWLDAEVRVGSRYRFAQTLPSETRSARACTAADLEFAAEEGYAAGSILGGLYAHNVAATRCALRGAPYIELVSASGVVYASTSAHPQFQPAAKTVVLETNSWAVSAPWHIGASCGGEGATSTLRVTVRGDSTVRRLPFKVGADDGPKGCIVEGVTPHARPHPGRLDTPPFAPVLSLQDSISRTLGALTATMQLPEKVQAGKTLSYAVVLSNASPDTAFVGDGDAGNGDYAPLYRQRLREAETASYQLDWNPIRELGPGEAVAYQMRLRVPADQPAGPTELTWQFVEPELPPITATVMVQR